MCDVRGVCLEEKAFDQMIKLDSAVFMKEKTGLYRKSYGKTQRHNETKGMAKSSLHFHLAALIGL